jgi:hypothetical protein
MDDLQPLARLLSFFHESWMIQAGCRNDFPIPKLLDESQQGRFVKIPQATWDVPFIAHHKMNANKF